jgi:phosphoserine phosphatase
VFDLDGVLVSAKSSWEKVHETLGCNNELNYEKYMEGEIDYAEFMRSDISLWKNVSIERIREILNSISLAEGAAETIQALRTKGVKTAIVSSGISLLADRVGRELGIDFVYSNKLVEDSDGRITCREDMTVPLLGKLAVTMRILEQEKIQSSECVVVGDSLFDLPPYGSIGLSIGFNCHDEQSRNRADILLEGPDLRVLLPWLTSRRPSRISVSLPVGSRVADSLVAALSPDNIKIPQGLGIQVFASDNHVFVRIVSVRGLETLLATVDDVLSCTQMAIGLVDVVTSYQLAKTI